MRNEKKPLTISKRAKGFPLRFKNQHLLVIHQTYAWLKSHGIYDESTEAGIKCIPMFTDPIDQSSTDVDKVVDRVIAEGVRCMTWKPGPNWKDPEHTLTKNRTVRIRAEHLHDVARLFRLLSNYVAQGQVATTIISRAEALEGVSILDQLADAQRGSSENASLSLRD